LRTGFRWEEAVVGAVNSIGVFSDKQLSRFGFWRLGKRSAAAGASATHLIQGLKA
jgi:hypothetical protein